MTLQNLNEMAEKSKDEYLSRFINEDLELSRDFKEQYSRVLKTRDGSINFTNYSAEIITSAGNRIYCPNQWFYIATFVVEYVSELEKYKNSLENIFNREVLNMSRKKFWEEIKSLKDQSIDSNAPKINDAIFSFFEDDLVSAEFLCRFITDYHWWHGSKTIDRHDYYVSPTLKLLGLVNVSQAYVADIVYHLASDSRLMYSAITMKQEIRNDAETLGENLIVYGAPGTGKSRYLEDNFPNATRVVFHSEYSYFDFVGNYKPVPLYKETDTPLYRINEQAFQRGEPRIDYQFVPGPFINVLIKAMCDKDSNYTLLIEEINRANAPSVFGDIFQLLDRRSDGRSDYEITPNKDLEDYLGSLDISDYFQDGLFIPRNMNIVATMNSADQGVYVLDSAFKRRWRFKYMPIKEKGFVHESKLVIYAGESYEWRHLLTSINNKLKSLGVNEDRLIGPYFISPAEIEDSRNIASKLLIYLWDDVARYKRNELFIQEIKTYSELVESYDNDVDIMEISDSLNDLLRVEEELSVVEELEETELNDG